MNATVKLSNDVMLTISYDPESGELSAKDGEKSGSVILEAARKAKKEKEKK